MFGGNGCGVPYCGVPGFGYFVWGWYNITPTGCWLGFVAVLGGFGLLFWVVSVNFGI